MRLPGIQRALIGKLIGLIDELYAETVSFLDKPEEAQLWYNRGYANGIIAGLDALGYGELLDERITRDPADIISGFEIFDWGQAYRHGRETGDRETREVIGPAPGHG